MFLNASTLWHRLIFRLLFRSHDGIKGHVRERFPYMAFYTVTESFFESTEEIASAFTELKASVARLPSCFLFRPAELCLSPKAPQTRLAASASRSRSPVHNNSRAQ